MGTVPPFVLPVTNGHMGFEQKKISSGYPSEELAATVPSRAPDLSRTSSRSYQRAWGQNTH